MTLEKLKNENILDTSLHYAIWVLDKYEKIVHKGIYKIQNIPDIYNDNEIEISADLYGIYIIIKQNVSSETLLKDAIFKFDINTKVLIKKGTIEYIDYIKFLDTEILNSPIQENLMIQNDFIKIKLKG